MTEPYYQTDFGSAYRVDSLIYMRDAEASSVNLVFTSPPYALIHKKGYANEVADSEYIEWFLPFAREIHRILRDDGSFVLNIGNVWQKGQPTKSLYIYKLLIALVEEVGFHLAQEVWWCNPAGMPVPGEWTNVRRVRLKDNTQPIFWLSKTPHPKANNRNVLCEYTERMKKRIENPAKKHRLSPSGHKRGPGLDKDNGGSIQANLLTFPATDSSSWYHARCRETGTVQHPARFPVALPDFFIKFLTDPDDLVLDPFGGSNTTGFAAERLQRRWVACELDEEYLKGSQFRFEPEALNPLTPKVKSVRQQRRKQAVAGQLDLL